ncbi:hypothetical protein QFC19_004115 [Naganishia cerealis]|uniref:Uncharacterized protein n=1 Tax=Naganishia cerealis TaxID=610337 RepID=A0ACC2VZ99_9TREE|nr:hypothetical protein QFC19_004115 [Naganishia cerealis]
MFCRNSVPKSANVATSQRPPLGHTDVNKHNFPASNTTSARPSEMTPAITQPEASSSTDPSAGPNSSLGGRPSISTASSSIDPSAGPNSSNGGRPSISAASGSKPASAPGQNPTASTHKQAESRTKRSRSSSRPKDSAARSEQEDKSGTGTRTGSGHSAKGKGKATAYNPRVDPAVLNLVK